MEPNPKHTLIGKTNMFNYKPGKTMLRRTTSLTGPVNQL